MKNVKLFSILIIILLAVSCKNKDVNPNLPVANFTADNDTIPYGIGSNLVFNFTNTSSNATTYRWDFGGGYSATTTNGYISYTTTDLTEFFTLSVFADGNLYTNQIRLTAKNGSDSSVITKTIVIKEEF
jgi:PKD repeat protein